MLFCNLLFSPIGLGNVPQGTFRSFLPSLTVGGRLGWKERQKVQTHKHPLSIELGPVICSCKQCCRKDLYPGFLGYILKYFCRTEIARSVGMHVFFLPGWILPSPHAPPQPKGSTSLHSQQLPGLPSAGMHGFSVGVSLPFCCSFCRSSRLSSRLWPDATFLSFATRLCQRPHSKDSEWHLKT